MTLSRVRSSVPAAVRRRPRWALAGLLAVVVLVGGFGWWALRGSRVPEPRARVYTAFNACLLTDSAGVNGSAAAPVWAGMQTASVQTSGKVSFLAVTGPQTAGNARLFVGSLLARHCDLVLAVGPAPVAAAREQSAAHASTRFVLIEGGPDSGAGAGGTTGGGTDRTGTGGPRGISGTGGAGGITVAPTGRGGNGADGGARANVVVIPAGGSARATEVTSAVHDVVAQAAEKISVR